MAYHDGWRWAEQALTAADLDIAWEKLLVDLSNLGIENAAFVFGQPTGHRRACVPSRKFGTFLDKEWDQRVHEDFKLAMADPIARRFFVDDCVLQVERGNDLFLSMTEKEKAFFDHYDEHGIRAGTVWPVHDHKAGVVHLLATWTRDDPRSYRHTVTRSQTDIHVATTFLSEALRVRQLTAQPITPALSPRERECLLWAQAGRSTKQIGDRLRISDNTVNEYVTSAMRKLDASNRIQAAARATMLDLIRP